MNTTGFDYMRKGISTAAICVFTDDKEAARTRAIEVAERDYPGCRVYESRARANGMQYNHLAYMGPTVTVSVKLVRK